MKFFVCLFFIGAYTVIALPANDEVEIIASGQDVRPDGYEYNYELSNGIKAEARGDLKDPETLVSSGQYSYISPEGQPIAVQYTADENGYHPQGDHLPTPHPIPEIIQRALKYIEEHPTQNE